MLLVVGLLGGTAAAFAVTEGLKLQKSPIRSTRVTKVFSPVCGCPSASAAVSFRLRHADHLTVSIQDTAGAVVRTLFESRPAAAGFHVYFWNGRLDDGTVAAPGGYRARLELDDADRTIVLPNRISVDTVPPRVLSVGVDFSPRGIVVRYRASEHAHGLLYVGGRRIVKTYRAPLVGAMTITRAALGALGAHGPLGVAVEDPAGNVSKVRVLRYVIRENA